MVQWHFGESPEDGEAWLKRPHVFHAYVDYLAMGGHHHPRWRRVMVATQSWLTAQLGGLGTSGSGPSWVGLPAMLVVPDASGEQLRGIVDAMVQQGGFDHYSAPLGEPEPSST